MAGHKYDEYQMYLPSCKGDDTFAMEERTEKVLED